MRGPQVLFQGFLSKGKPTKLFVCPAYRDEGLLHFCFKASGREESSGDFHGAIPVSLREPRRKFAGLTHYGEACLLKFSEPNWLNECEL